MSSRSLSRARARALSLSLSRSRSPPPLFKDNKQPVRSTSARGRSSVFLRTLLRATAAPASQHTRSHPCQRVRLGLGGRRRRAKGAGRGGRGGRGAEGDDRRGRGRGGARGAGRRGAGDGGSGRGGRGAAAHPRRAALAANADALVLNAVVVAPAVEGTRGEIALRARARHVVHPNLRCGAAAEGHSVAAAARHRRTPIGRAPQGTAHHLCVGVRPSVVCVCVPRLCVSGWAWCVRACRCVRAAGCRVGGGGLGCACMARLCVYVGCGVWGMCGGACLCGVWGVACLVCVFARVIHTHTRISQRTYANARTRTHVHLYTYACMCECVQCVRMVCVRMRVYTQQQLLGCTCIAYYVTSSYLLYHIIMCIHSNTQRENSVRK